MTLQKKIYFFRGMWR